MNKGVNMKKLFFIFMFLFIIGVSLYAQFLIPRDAVLIESNQLKNDGKAYVIEQRWKLKNGDILYAYYDAEGTNEAITQRIEKSPILAIGTDVKVDAMPGHREFNFNDRRQLVQFMKIMGLLIAPERYSSNSNYEEPNVALRQLQTTSNNYLFILSLDLYDQSWSLLKVVYYSSGRNILSNENYDVKRKDGKK